MKKSLTFLFLFFLLMEGLFAVHSLDFNISRDENRLGIDINAILQNTLEIKNALRDGVTYQVKIDIELYEKMSGFLKEDILLKKIQVKRVVSFTEFKKKYSVQEGDKELHFTNPAKLYSYILSFNSQDLYASLETNKTYRIYVTFTGESVKVLYFPLDIIIGAFVDLIDVKIGPIKKEFQIQ